MPFKYLESVWATRTRNRGHGALVEYPTIKPKGVRYSKACPDGWREKADEDYKPGDNPETPSYDRHSEVPNWPTQLQFPPEAWPTIQYPFIVTK
jgi:hypothetical protein